MKQIIFIFLISLTGYSGYSQKIFFYLYTDSASLVQDANFIVKDFTLKVNKIKPVVDSQPLAILNTRPFLIFYSSKANKVNLPIWSQVITEQKDFFYNLAGNTEEGKKMFGFFFNGFYLPHELGHALQHASNQRLPDLYRNEYIANEIAILYWRKVQRKKKLKQCYKYAKKIISQLKSPVPEGEEPIKYFNEHYATLGADPYKNGYFQFAQFVKIYGDKTLPLFDVYIKNYLATKPGN